MKELLVIVAVAVFLGLTGCIPPETVVELGGDPEVSGEIKLAGSLLTTEAEMEVAMNQEKGGGGDYTPLTHTQWSQIINIKAAQVTTMVVEISRLSDGTIVYYGDSPVVNGNFNTSVRGIRAGEYIVTLGFKGQSYQWLFSATERVDVAAQTTTTATIVVYLNNYCQKQFRVIGLDSAVAQTTTPAIVMDHPDGGSYTIIGEGFWFPSEPNVMEIVFRDNLPFDITQPLTLSFLDETGRPAESMQLEFDPVEIAGWTVSVPFVPLDLGDLTITVYTSRPMGKV